ncbi:MAG TPA: histidine kinase dimerization/phospho-acceptor domain-containing protein [Roseiflexaceae bacterium]|nr:histidine kinase dimerization/phospho-acceptor domain-containing protein [Roseiflexaceae bacterium]
MDSKLNHILLVDDDVDLAHLVVASGVDWCAVDLGREDGSVQLLRRRLQRAGGLDERDERALNVIVEQSARLDRMISMLLDISRLQTGRLSIERAALDAAALIHIRRPGPLTSRLRLLRPALRICNAAPRALCYTQGGAKP